MDNPEKNIATKNSAIGVIEEVWHRARINAFAHKEAMQDYSKGETRNFQWIIITSLLSILFIIIMYVKTTMDGHPSKSTDGTIPVNETDYWVIIWTLLSIITSIGSLYFAIMGSHHRYGIRAEEHKYLMNSYQHIAQRAREVKWPDMPSDEIIALLKDLERDFALLKARGSEPLDIHYVNAHNVFNKVKSDKDTSVAQSFKIDVTPE